MNAGRSPLLPWSPWILLVVGCLGCQPAFWLIRGLLGQLTGWARGSGLPSRQPAEELLKPWPSHGQVTQASSLVHLRIVSQTHPPFITVSSRAREPALWEQRPPPRGPGLLVEETEKPRQVHTQPHGLKIRQKVVWAELCPPDSYPAGLTPAPENATVFGDGSLQR